MRLDDYCRAWRERLRQAGMPEPERDIRILVRELAGLRDADFITEPGYWLASSVLTDLDAALERRMAGEPVSKILGVREFWGLDFFVNGDVLDPRPDSETLIETALSGPAATNFIDLGTGSGCLAIALLTEWPNASASAVEISAAALRVAERNAMAHQIADRLSLLHGSWWKPVQPSQRFDLIISNPPYIRSGEIVALDRAVRIHDPILALDGGEDGLEPYRIILEGALPRLLPHGRILFECGYDQAGALSRLAGKYGFLVSRIQLDLGGVARVVEMVPA